MCLRWRSFAVLSIKLGGLPPCIGSTPGGQPPLFAIPGDRKAKAFRKRKEMRGIEALSEDARAGMIEPGHLPRRQGRAQPEAGPRERHRPGKTCEQPLRQED